MLKTAYQIGLRQALQEGNISQLLKEAQELGIDVEKVAFGLAGLGRMGQLGQAVGKAVGWGAKHPMAARMAGGAAMGGGAAALTGGNVSQGMMLGGLGGAAVHGMGGKAGMGKWMMGGPAGGGRDRFMRGLAQGAL